METNLDLNYEINKYSLNSFFYDKALVELVNKNLFSIVIPVFNEEKTILELLERVQNISIPKEIIIIDDFSSDGTRPVLEKYCSEHDNVKLYLHEYNQGKGAALRTGFEKVTGDVVIIQDADLEYHPGEYYRLIYPILIGEADVVYGSRFLGEAHRVLFFWHYVANKMLTTFSNMMTNLNLTDMETCYKVFRRQVLENLVIKSNRFGFEPEFTAKIAKRKWRIFEMGINYYGRDYSQGKKIGWKDAVSAFFQIVRFRFFD